MNGQIIRKHIFDFIKINKRHPAFIALTIDQFYKYKASKYFPGLKANLDLDDFKRFGIPFHYRWKGKPYAVTLIWRDAVIA